MPKSKSVNKPLALSDLKVSPLLSQSLHQLATSTGLPREIFPFGQGV